MKHAFRTGFMFGLGYLVAKDLFNSFNVFINKLDEKYDYTNEMRRALGLPEKKKRTQIHKRVKNKIGFAID